MTINEFQKSNKNNGFTLIEMIVAMSLFVIVISISIGIFLRTVQSERGVANQAAAVSNTALAMEEMAREMRTGNGFEICSGGNSCHDDSPAGSDAITFSYQSGSGPSNLAYEVTYYLKAGQITRDAKFSGNGNQQAPTGPITAQSVNVDYLRFYSCGTGGNAPPRIVIAIQAQPVTPTSGFTGAFNLQTTVSERLYYYEQNPVSVQVTSQFSCPKP
ncbi:MAG TPA: type II secretion system protein [Candidatus Tyrphobacter sp.]|nr:type II secretion system protein [Candidatus Tyrphobacter sp.]